MDPITLIVAVIVFCILWYIFSQVITAPIGRILLIILYCCGGLWLILNIRGIIHMIMGLFGGHGG